MSETLTTLAPHLARHPLLLTVAAAAVLCVVTAGLRVTAAGSAALAARSVTLAAILALPAYAGVVIFYVQGPEYFDAAEPTMAAVGWLFQAGLPVYHGVDAAERYAHIYGPMVFIAQGAAMAAFGATIETSKWVGGALSLAALGLTAFAMQRDAGTRRALVLTGLCAVVLLGFRNYAFWTRAEPLQLFSVAAMLAATARWNGHAATILAGVFAGILWNLKITGPAYTLPLFVLLASRAGWPALVASLAVAVVTAIAPFVLVANVSFEAYSAWLRLSAQTGLLLSTLRQNIEWAVFLGVPLALSYFSAPAPRAVSRQWSLVAMATGLATCGVIVAGSKPGAGPYHLLPLLPLAGYLAAARLGAEAPRFPARGAEAAIAWVLVAVLVAVTQQLQFITTMTGRRSLGVARDIQQFASRQRGVVEMGYGVSDPLTFARPLLVFRNNSYFLDQPAIGEHQLAGLPIPAATIEALRRCRVNYWLVPRDETPFTAVNMYNAVYLKPLFPDEFRRAFFETHDRVETTTYFDVWECRASQ
jgi:hypothetical protein